MRGGKQMRLVVKRNGETVNEFRFSKGPIHIGRHAHSHVFLPDRAVSRQHAVISATQDGKWVVEDLDSANKTYLNKEAIDKAEIKTGDCLHIADFTIEITLEADIDADKAIHLEDTLISAPGKLKPALPQGTPYGATASARGITVRRPDVEDAPDIALPAKRIKDFLQATETICRANGPDEVLKALLSITSRQFGAYHVWCALRNQPTGPMTSHAGRRRDGQTVDLGEIKLNKEITEAIDKKEFLLLPQAPAQTEDEGPRLAGTQKIRSAMIVPIMDPAGCFGVLYIDNAADQESYSLGDLDYAVLLAIHTAAIVENF
jgi:hypothetical protein